MGQTAIVTVRELRNQGGLVLDRVIAGERITVTRDGRPVAELSPLAGTATSLATLKQRAKKLVPIDLESLRRDLDEIVDPWL